ncbi:hypothetical protein ACFQ07_09410, partial [Actinomadura adrarensis]
MTRTEEILRGLGALTALLFLLGFPPIFLYATGGLPFPDRMPDWEEVYVTLMQPDYDYSVFTGFLRLILWGLWASYVGIIGTEIVRYIAEGDKRADRSDTGRPTQDFARRLVAMTALIFTAGTAVTQTVEPPAA